MGQNFRIVIFLFLIYAVFSPIQADELIDKAGKVYYVSAKKVDDSFVYCTGEGYFGLMRLPIEAVNSLILDDGTVIIENNEVVQTLDVNMDTEQNDISSFDPNLFNYGSEDKLVKSQVSYASFGYMCFIVSGGLGLVNTNREYNGESADELESFIDQTKLIQNLHYGFMILGASILIYSNNDTEKTKPIVTNNN